MTQRVVVVLPTQKMFFNKGGYHKCSYLKGYSASSSLTGFQKRSYFNYFLNFGVCNMWLTLSCNLVAPPVAATRHRCCMSHFRHFPSFNMTMFLIPAAILKIEHGEDRKELALMCLSSHACTNMHAWLDRQNKDEDAINPLYLIITKPFALSECTKFLGLWVKLYPVYPFLLRSVHSTLWELGCNRCPKHKYCPKATNCTYTVWP